MIRIIHLSDYHLESDAPSFEKKALTAALATDLSKFATDDSVLFFTGDMIDRGAKNFGEYKIMAFESFEAHFIDIILESNPGLKNKIFCVPGNHDVFRNKMDEYADTGLKQQLDNEVALTSFINDCRENPRHHLERLEDYKKWEVNFYKSFNNKQLSSFENSFKVNLSNSLLGITCLNSSWLCKDDSDKEKLLIGKAQLQHSLEFLKDCDIKLALAHHPLSFLNRFDKEAVNIELNNEYSAYFCGHVHEADGIYSIAINGGYFTSIANSTIADSPTERKHVNGYSIIDFFPNDKIHVHYRKYIEQTRTFVPNTEVGTEDGTVEFSLVKPQYLKELEKNLDLVNRLRNQNADKLNNHIIMSNTATDVICSVENIFVEPTILNCPDRSFKEEDTVQYSIDGLLRSKSNYLIYGSKESGKTLLLDKLFLDSLDKFDDLKRIPLIFNFSEFRGKDPEKMIREFLGISAAELPIFLQSHSLVLLIDDFSFSDRHTDVLTSLKKLLATYSDIKLIAASTSILENKIPTEYLGHNDVFNFELSFIQSFSSKEIKQLINKWFQGKEIDFQEKMDKLLKSFKDFGLPRTPLSVTMFLWIFEKQEKKPINNSVLVELFIENLLEKTKIENIYSSTFDFKNKQRLLSFIAKFMKDNGDGDTNYSIGYVKLLDFVSEYLASRFHGQPQKVLDDLIRRGILTYDYENQVRFKASFAFHYFLAIHFDISTNFKASVFSEPTYLDYTEEITYYAGLKRDDEAVLQFTLDRLIEAFGEDVLSIQTHSTEIDQALEPVSNAGTIAYHANEDIVYQKPKSEELDDYYDHQLSNSPVNTTIEKKGAHARSTKKNVDMVLKLAANVLKNSEDVDSFNLKVECYKYITLSSIAFMMHYRNALIRYYQEFKTSPKHFPKNINFNLFIKMLPLINQVALYDWVGSPKLKPVILNKIEADKLNLSASEYEKLFSIYMYSDIRGSKYPEVVKGFVKSVKYKYAKDISFLKIMSYFHLRKNSQELDAEYKKLMADIQQDLGRVEKKKRYKFLEDIQKKKDQKSSA
ncbi:metallophosphoesterase [Mucilaginibacter segetis]|uniref:Metallophosphoesterase n=1 Tax=Mucilaginibacter segetis TaxID=2793071 RepID=A0A934PT39_9SPHI|nr:metallophosphoesterase [Mucilaginibacter segetis]MBK0378930.1 metallophosphoesterase [Mucilaginibacter segetis]